MISPLYLRYKVKWAKWREATWEPAENLVGAADEALRLYHEKKPKACPKPKKKKEGKDGDGGGADGDGDADGGDAMDDE